MANDRCLKKNPRPLPVRILCYGFAWFYTTRPHGSWETAHIIRVEFAPNMLEATYRKASGPSTNSLMFYKTMWPGEPLTRTSRGCSQCVKLTMLTSNVPTSRPRPSSPPLEGRLIRG